MDELQALQLAINTLLTEAYYCNPSARKGRAHSEEQLSESELNERATRFKAAASVLQTMLPNYQPPAKETR